MDNGYRILMIGELIQDGDEVMMSNGRWLRCNALIHNRVTSIENIRRPISLSPTDATAHTNDEWPDEKTKHQYPWELCPIGFKWAATDRDGERYFYLDKPTIDAYDNWGVVGADQMEYEEISGEGNIEDWKGSLQEIPHKEEELNGWAEHLNFPAPTDEDICYQNFKITEQEWSERRKLRIDAGVIKPTISKTETVDYDISIHSNPDHNAWAKFFIESWPNGCSDEETMAGWFANAMMAKHDSMASSEMGHTPWDGEGLPPVGIECEIRCRYGARGSYTNWAKGYFKAGYDYKIWFKYADEDLIFPSHDVEFRQIKPEQTEREKFVNRLGKSMSDAGSIITDFETINDISSALFEWLNSDESPYQLVNKDGE